MCAYDRAERQRHPRCPPLRHLWREHAENKCERVKRTLSWAIRSKQKETRNKMTKRAYFWWLDRIIENRERHYLLITGTDLLRARRSRYLPWSLHGAVVNVNVPTYYSPRRAAPHRHSTLLRHIPLHKHPAPLASLFGLRLFLRFQIHFVSLYSGVNAARFCRVAPRRPESVGSWCGWPDVGYTWRVYFAADFTEFRRHLWNKRWCKTLFKVGLIQVKTGLSVRSDG